MGIFALPAYYATNSVSTISQNCEALNYPGAEAWNVTSFFYPSLKKFKK
jgi:hypothetical protein